jgi:hypothetical protein
VAALVERHHVKMSGEGWSYQIPPVRVRRPTMQEQ